MNSDTIIFSISVVVYQPQLDVLTKEFAAFKAAFLLAREKFSIRFLLYVVDNSEVLEYSTPIDESLNAIFSDLNFVEVNYLKSPKNLGYGYGNNLIIKQLSSDYHLVINPDVFVEQDAFVNALQYLQDNPKIGLLLPAVYGEDGKQHFLCKRNPTLFDMFLRSFAPGFLRKVFLNRIQRFEMLDQDYAAEIKNIAYPSGCFMLFRTEILQKINGFDERFFMYIEDADIGRRILEIADSVYLPQVKIIHKWSRKTHAELKFRWITIKSVLSYWWKYGGIY